MKSAHEVCTNKKIHRNLRAFVPMTISIRCSVYGERHLKSKTNENTYKWTNAEINT